MKSEQLRKQIINSLTVSSGMNFARICQIFSQEKSSDLIAALDRLEADKLIVQYEDSTLTDMELFKVTELGREKAMYGPVTEFYSKKNREAGNPKVTNIFTDLGFRACRNELELSIKIDRIYESGKSRSQYDTIEIPYDHQALKDLKAWINENIED